MTDKTQFNLRVHYPVESGRLTVRTDQNWNRAVEAVAVSPDRQTWTFELLLDRPYIYYKPCLEMAHSVAWSRGNNYLAIPVRSARRPEAPALGCARETVVEVDVYPHFHGKVGGTIGKLIEVPAANGVCSHLIRCYYPPGYHQNPLQRFPVLYMHDGNNLFFPGEAFLGSDWQVEQTMDMLDAMNIIRPCIVVGVYPRTREVEYTAPGYHEYGRFLIDEIKHKTVDQQIRTMPGPSSTAVMGSSLGGVVSLFMAWEWPETVGMAACMSSTFTWRDNLMERIAREPRRSVRLYLDSGWPGDNYEVTRSMRDLLLHKGYQYGRDLLYFAFPEALHDERHWAMRSHIPFQFFFGDTYLHAPPASP